MGINYRKRIKIAPGIRLNVSKKGISSVSIGKRGASVNLNKQGSQATFGIPGTGISYQTKRSGTNTKAVKKIENKNNVSIGQNQVTVEQIINNKEHALAMMDIISYNYNQNLRKNPFFAKKKKQQKIELENLIYQMQNERVEDRQILLSVEQILREFSLLRFAKKENLDLDNLSMYQSALLLYIGNFNSLTKKKRKEFLEDTIVELSDEHHLLSK